MTRDEAYQLLTKYLQNKNLIKHSLSCEVTMKALYRHFNEGKSSYAKATEDTWGITGLLHDVDYEISQKNGDVEKHGTLVFIPEKDTIPADILHGIQAHAYHYSKVMPENNMDWAITACDQLTGLIVAAALVTPEKKLSTVTTEKVLKRFKEKAFAKGADREEILKCESQLNIPLAEFVAITLTAMQTISNDLGL
ncbi:MAG TPA: phosphohydrolase [Patescibacteria group bacterium]|nr:phosphohydrolase [Patescibacteria group bacterium]